MNKKLSWCWQTRATRLEVNQGHRSSIPYVRYSFILCNSNFVVKTRRFYDIQLHKCRDLENRDRGPSRSLEMSPCDRAHMTSYWRSIVTIASILCRFWDIQCRKMPWHWNWGQRSLKVIERITILYSRYGFLLVFYRNFVPKCTDFEILAFSNAVTLKSGSKLTQGHHSIEPIRLPIDVLY